MGWLGMARQKLDSGDLPTGSNDAGLGFNLLGSSFLFRLLRVAAHNADEDEDDGGNDDKYDKVGAILLGEDSLFVIESPQWRWK